MKKFFFLMLMSAFFKSSDEERLLIKVLSKGTQNVNFMVGQEIQDQIDDLKKLLYSNLIPQYQKTESMQGKKFIRVMLTYVFGNLIALYMIQKSIVLESDIPNQIAIFTKGKFMKDKFKELSDKYMPNAVLNEDSIKKLFNFVNPEEWLALQELSKTFYELSNMPIPQTLATIEDFFEKYDLVNFGKGILEEYKKIGISFKAREENLINFINTVNSLLRFKSFLYEDQALKLRNSLYRFIQLYSLFLILDDVKPTQKINDILSEMQLLGSQLQVVFKKEFQIIVAQSTQKIDNLTRQINQKNKELILAFNNLLKVIDDAALNLSLNLFAKDLAVLNALI